MEHLLLMVAIKALNLRDLFIRVEGFGMAIPVSEKNPGVGK